ncbi:MAG: hypothetical protein M1816_007484 [Peltula sp. TS41687]|nr:MAG: hypothetical protein M1816_007484 [Peltula sp. TS41687]
MSVRSLPHAGFPTTTAAYHVSTIKQQEKISESAVPVKVFTTAHYPKASSALAGSLVSSGVETLLPVDEAQSPLSASSSAVTAESNHNLNHNLSKSVVEMMPPTMKRFTLQEKICVVTGGARGLGFNIAQGLAEVGAKGIVLMDINQELGDAAAAELHEKCQVPVTFYKVDVRDEKAIATVIDNVVETYGSVDVVVNSAGIADSNIKAEDYSADAFRRLIDINLTGSFLVAQACARHMMLAGTGGSIIFIASMSGSIVNYPQEQCCYNASKAAVIQLGKSLAAEWARHNIRVNCISPGYMDTELNRVPALDAQKKIWTSMTPQARLGEVHELNGLAVYLGSDAASFVTGANFTIDGGYSVY